MQQPINSPRPIKCLYCRYEFMPEPVVTKAGKKKRTYIECPRCGNRDQSKMSVARRTCGYIGTQFWNQGRTQEIRDRVLHVGISEMSE